MKLLKKLFGSKQDDPTVLNRSSEQKRSAPARSRGLDELEDALLRGDSTAREELVRIGPSALSSMRRVLFQSGSSLEARQQAIWVLGKIGGDTEALLAALEENDWTIKYAAAEALGNVRDPKAVQPLIGVLGERGVGEVAAKALGKIGDARAVEPLIEITKDASKTSNVRAAAVEGLGGIGSAEAIIALKELASSGDGLMKYEAATALKKLGQLE
ncbi:MAG: HEAT repeat domain-containing protein [Anaerolineae bacterium]|nr:HEAT repeat domain-containing protein [Anaerolineae bacterium]